MRHKHRLAADGIFQHQADDAQRNCRASGKAAEPCEAALKHRKRRAVHNDGTVEQHSGQAVRIELECPSAGIGAADDSGSSMALVAQYHALHGDRSVAERSADGYALTRHHQAGVEQEAREP